VTRVPPRRAPRTLAALALASGAFGATPAEDLAEAARRIEAAGADLAAAVEPTRRLQALSRAIEAYQAASVSCVPALAPPTRGSARCLKPSPPDGARRST
jgi:hypothetical protein